MILVSIIGQVDRVKTGQDLSAVFKTQQAKAPQAYSTAGLEHICLLTNCFIDTLVGCTTTLKEVTSFEQKLTSAA